MISTLTWVVICIVLLVIKYGFLVPMEDKRLFRMYEARDNVALAAIEGKISQDAPEYKYVIEKINFEIYYTKNNYDFSILLKNLLLRPEEVKKYFDSMYQLVEQYEILRKSYNLSEAYFKKSLNLRVFFFMHLIIKPFSLLLDFAIFILTVIENIANIGENIVNALKRRVEIINMINSDYYNYRKTIF